jgi:hypothetical protein
MSLSSQLNTAQSFEQVFRAIHKFRIEYDGVSDKYVRISGWNTRSTLTRQYKPAGVLIGLAGLIECQGVAPIIYNLTKCMTGYIVAELRKLPSDRPDIFLTYRSLRKKKQSEMSHTVPCSSGWFDVTKHGRHINLFIMLLSLLASSVMNRQISYTEA